MVRSGFLSSILSTDPSLCRPGRPLERAPERVPWARPRGAGGRSPVPLLVAGCRSLLVAEPNGTSIRVALPSSVAKSRGLLQRVREWQAGYQTQDLRAVGK